MQCPKPLDLWDFEFSFEREKLLNHGKMDLFNKVVYLLVCCEVLWAAVLAANYKLNTKSNYKLDATPRDRPDAGERERQKNVYTHNWHPAWSVTNYKS